MMLKLNAWLSGLSASFTGNGEAQSTLSLNNRLRWQLRHKLPMLGWPGMVAISLLVVLPLLYFSTIRPMQARVELAQRSIASAQEQILAASKTASGAGSSPREQLTEFYKFFPREKDSPLWLEKMVAVAEESGLSLDEGEYKVTQDKVGQLIRYTITLPVQGKYLQIRKYLASLAAEIPSMALENVQFERKDINDSNVQVKIKLVLYLVQES